MALLELEMHATWGGGRGRIKLRSGGTHEPKSNRTSLIVPSKSKVEQYSSHFIAAVARCDVGLVQGPSANECYKFVSNADSWYAAEWHCEKLGGTLASVGNAFISSFLKSEVPSRCSGDYWLGGSKDDRTSVWAWSDGTPFSYKNWDTST